MDPYAFLIVCILIFALMIMACGSIRQGSSGGYRLNPKPVPTTRPSPPPAQPYPAYAQKPVRWQEDAPRKEDE